MTEAIVQYVQNRKQKWLEDKLKNKKSEEQKQDYINEAMEKYSLANWIRDAAKQASQIVMVSHPSKFSHPKIKSSSAIIAVAQDRRNGYVCSGNVAYELDALGNAGALDVYKFLLLKLSDQQTVLAHFKSGTDLIKSFIDKLNLDKPNLDKPNLDFEDLKQCFLSLENDQRPAQTHSLLKQVYFPLNNNGDYHLLSLLTASGIVTKLKQHIDNLHFGESNKIARQCKKNNQWHEYGYQELNNLTVIGYGGGNPQNISVLNNQNRGRAYLLSSMPPKLSKRTVRLPNKNFFDQCLFKSIFITLFKILTDKINDSRHNKRIREMINATLNQIVEEILNRATRIQHYPSGWSTDPKSSYHNLPTSQRLWLDLDKQYQKERQTNPNWRNDIKTNMADWIRLQLEQHVYAHLKLTDQDLQHIKQLIKGQLEENLEQDKEFF